MSDDEDWITEDMNDYFLGTQVVLIQPNDAVFSLFFKCSSRKFHLNFS